MCLPLTINLVILIYEKEELQSYTYCFKCYLPCGDQLILRESKVHLAQLHIKWIQVQLELTDKTGTRSTLF